LGEHDMKKVILLLSLVLVTVILSGCLMVEETPTNRLDENQPTQPANNETPAAPDENTAPADETNGGEVMTEVVGVSDNVKVHYLGTYEDGEVFDGSVDEQKNPIKPPLAFTAGVGQMIPGFDKAVLGMALNEEKNVTIPPEEAYGTEGAHPMAGKTLVFWIKVIEIEKK
jgi:FKBP-type peptidyl-prolyl cis-trans isomerase